MTKKDDFCTNVLEITEFMLYLLQVFLKILNELHLQGCVFYLKFRVGVTRVV